MNSVIQYIYFFNNGPRYSSATAIATGVWDMIFSLTGPVLRRGGKRDFSPCVSRGLGERSTRVSREYASTYCTSTVRTKFVDPILKIPYPGIVQYTVIK